MRRAMITNLPFDPSFVEDSVRAVRQAGYRCAATGRPFDIDYRSSGAGGTHFAPSPDRIAPELGYVRGNVRWVLWCLNRGKGRMSAEEYLEICRLAAAYKAEPIVPEDAGGGGGGVPPAGAVDASEPVPLTRRQAAALKAHITMTRRSLNDLTGDARAAALRKLARLEARLDAALSSSA